VFRSLFFGFTLYPVLSQGQACLLARQGPAAGADFQKILDHRGLVPTVAPLSARSRTPGLARAYAVASDQAKARCAYHDFLARWKDVDPDIPILQQAKSEYAKFR
jgi:hypothetical protein